MIKFRCKIYSSKLARFIYGSKKAMRAIDSAGLKVRRKLKEYITHKPPTVRDSISMRKSNVRLAREALNAETRIKAAMYEPERAIGNIIDEHGVKPILEAPISSTTFFAYQIPGSGSEILEEAVGNLEKTAWRKARKKFIRENSNTKLDSVRDKIRLKIKNGLINVLGAARRLYL